MNNQNQESLKFGWYLTKIITLATFVVIIITMLFMVGCPRYKVWQQGLEGQAELARATQLDELERRVK